MKLVSIVLFLGLGSLAHANLICKGQSQAHDISVSIIQNSASSPASYKIEMKETSGKNPAFAAQFSAPYLHEGQRVEVTNVTSLYLVDMTRLGQKLDLGYMESDMDAYFIAMLDCKNLAGD